MTSTPRWQEVMLGNYGVPPVTIISGNGCVLTDSDGKKYLDLLAGIAVSTLGHAHPVIVDAVSAQVAKLAHTSNLMAHEPGLLLAQKLLELAQSDGRVFFAQDGATANEAALKLARRWGYGQKPDGSKLKVIAMRNGFHGRTLGALAVTGNAAKREPFAPFGIHVEFVEFGNVAALADAMSSEVCAVILEPIQGEGGIIVPAENYLAQVRSITQENKCLMIVDEVQSAMGRSGEWFMSVAANVHPDIITFAKGIAAGMPLGGMIVDRTLIDVFQPGDHGTTFGGNPVSCAAALAMIEYVETHELLSKVRELGTWFKSHVEAMNSPVITQVRGVGLWIAIEFCDDRAASLESSLRSAGFIVNAVRPNALRLAPPLIISKDELAAFIFALSQLLDA